MTRRMGMRCLRCDDDCYEEVGQWLRLRTLCPDCVAKGYILELYANDAFEIPNRRWFVGIKLGGQWVKARQDAD